MAARICLGMLALAVPNMAAHANAANRTMAYNEGEAEGATKEDN